MGGGSHNHQHIIKGVLHELIKEVKSDPGVFLVNDIFSEKEKLAEAISAIL